jgi:hypothetical protein
MIKLFAQFSSLAHFIIIAQKYEICKNTRFPDLSVLTITKFSIPTRIHRALFLKLSCGSRFLNCQA